jgi:pimeloyl-ACP methyl ester carboxylesterase
MARKMGRMTHETLVALGLLSKTAAAAVTIPAFAAPTSCIQTSAGNRVACRGDFRKVGAESVLPRSYGVSMDRRAFMASGLGVVAATATQAVAAPGPAGSLPGFPQVTVSRIQVEGVNVFYREAGPADGPVLLLLHGFPASSFQYRELMPLLADRYRVIAPDLPGFGFTEVPAERKYRYSFETIAGTIQAFTEALQLSKYAMYVFDYGAPTGFRMALRHPERITAIVSQNGNAYEQGLGDAWDPIRKYWSEPTQDNRDAVRELLSPDGLKAEYLTGVPHPEQVKPEGYTLDAAMIARPGNMDIQLDLFLDYANNVKLYPEFQKYFRTSRPPILAIWGKNDPFFIPAGAAAYKIDNPNAEVRLLDTGHFALETHVREIAEQMRIFLDAQGIGS